MTKKIHVLADETLCGTLREYVEVNRRAEVGESVYTIISEEFRKVTRVEGVGAYLDDGGLVFHENYRVLEPTDIVLIDGNKYRLVDRKAEVGERVIIVNGGRDCPFTDGFVTDVIGIVGERYANVKPAAHLYHSEYRVLVPVESESSTDKPKSTDDIIANLVKRVAELERKYANLEDRTQRSFDGVYRDIETWAQDHSELAHKVARIADKQFNHGLDIGRLDDKIEMCIDDIVTLDERTQPKEITISVDDLAKLIGGVRG